MKSSTLLAALLALGMAVTTTANAELRAVNPESLTMTPAQRQATYLITDLLTKEHYKRAYLNDELSSELLDRYLETLDPARMYFFRNDARAFDAYRYRLDDLIASRLPNVTIAFEIFKRFRAREETPYKQHKINDEDWRNRAQWSAYETAVGDMLALTDTATAPWHLVPANNKRFARFDVLRHACKKITAALDA